MRSNPLNPVTAALYANVKQITFLNFGYKLFKSGVTSGPEWNAVIFRLLNVIA